MRTLPLSPSTTMSTEECKHSYCGEYKEIRYDTLYNSRTVYCKKVNLVFKEICNHLLNSSTDVKTAAVVQDFNQKQSQYDWTESFSITLEHGVLSAHSAHLLCADFSEWFSRLCFFVPHWGTLSLRKKLMAFPSGLLTLLSCFIQVSRAIFFFTFYLDCLFVFLHSDLMGYLEKLLRYLELIVWCCGCQCLLFFLCYECMVVFVNISKGKHGDVCEILKIYTQKSTKSVCFIIFVFQIWLTAAASSEPVSGWRSCRTAKK